MSYIRKTTMVVSTDASGDATARSQTLNGRLLQDGTAALYEARGAAVNDFLADELLKIVIASGGNTKTGSFVVVTES